MTARPDPLYDRLAAGYDATRDWPPAVSAAIGTALQAWFAPYARPGRGTRVLEIGAGTGRVLAPLAAGGAWTVGVDVSPAMLRLLRAKAPAATGAGALHAVLGDAGRLPVAAGAFDVALLVHILHLVGPWEPALAEAQRVVRAGGVQALGLDEAEPGEGAWIAAQWAARVTAAGGSTGASHQREAIIAAALEHLAGAGYRVDDHVPAQWIDNSTAADYLRRYQDRCFAASWDLPDAVLVPAVAALAADLRARYGRLDVPLPQARRFHVWLAQR